MNENTNNDFSKSNLAAEIKQLEEIGIKVTPELILRASFPKNSSERTLKDPVPSQKVNGRVVAGKGLFAGTFQINNLINEIREILAKDQIKDDLRERLLDLWITVEPCLLDVELNELRHTVLKRLFNYKDRQIIFSRDGSSIGGGY